MGYLARRRKTLERYFPCPKWKEPGATRPKPIDLVAPLGEIIPRLETRDGTQNVAWIPWGFLALPQTVDGAHRKGCELTYTSQRNQ